MLLVAFVAACQPFGETVAPEPDDLTEAPPPKRTSSSSAPSSSTSTSTSPTMPTSPARGDFCAGATFCDDFEKSDKGNGLWQEFTAINGDTFERSAPSAGAGAFSLDLKVAGGGPTKHSALQRDIGIFGHVEMTFAIQIPPTFGADGHTNIAHLDFGTGPEFVAVIGLVIKDDARSFDLVNEIEVTPKTWHEVRLVIDLPANPPTAHMEIDGKDVVTLDTLAVPFEGPPPFHLTVGADYKSTKDPFEIRIDDLRIDARD